jgi:hypothetical protein
MPLQNYLHTTCLFSLLPYSSHLDFTNNTSWPLYNSRSFSYVISWTVHLNLLKRKHSSGHIFFKGCYLRPIFKGQAWPLKMRPIEYPETSVTNYQSTLRNIEEARRSHLHRGGNLKSRNWSQYCFVYHHIQPFFKYGVTILGKFTSPGKGILISLSQSVRPYTCNTSRTGQRIFMKSDNGKG